MRRFAELTADGECHMSTSCTIEIADSDTTEWSFYEKYDPTFISGVSCNSGYVGVAVATACGAVGEAFTLTGCASL
eukprot:SAG11_NODE_12241_length_714_cov_0.547967_1_plen_75_part_10